MNRQAENQVLLRTGEHEHSLSIAPKVEGPGSSANGGELLFLALATCYCNDIYRGAKKRGLKIKSVEVEVSGEFGAEGEGARNVSYRSSVESESPREEVLELMRHTDSVAEIHNTLRQATPVVLKDCEVRGM
jgi:uncharacterized OsmC-like protein